MNSSNSTAVRDRSQAAKDLGSDGITAGPCVVVVAASTREYLLAATVKNGEMLGRLAVESRGGDQGRLWWKVRTLALIRNACGQPCGWPDVVKEGVRRGVRAALAWMPRRGAAA